MGTQVWIFNFEPIIVQSAHSRASGRHQHYPQYYKLHIAGSRSPGFHQNQIYFVSAFEKRLSLRDKKQVIYSEKKTWGSLSLPSKFKPDLGLFRTFGVDFSTSPGCGCSHASPCVRHWRRSLTNTICRFKRFQKTCGSGEKVS